MNRRSTLGLKALLTAGAVLAIALLVQTVVNYRYVSNNLILQEAIRVAQERVRNVDRAARLTRPQDREAFRVLLDDLRSETIDQVAGIALLQSDGTIVVASGKTTVVSVLDKQRQVSTARGSVMTHEWRDGRQILVGAFPCRCGLPRPAGDARGAKSDFGRHFVQVALYQDSLSAPFARLRRNAIVSASAALTLLVALSLIAARASAFVRGKQLEAQMDLARQVQRDILPSAGTGPRGVDFAAECLPAWQVGGDFYDVVSLPGGRVSFVLGDVSGHGISAALLMGLIHGAMSNPPWAATDDPPDRAAVRLNDLLLKKSSEERFASLFWCSYDPASHLLHYVNAGHLPALWLRRAANGTWGLERLSEGGPVLGLLTGAAYRTVSVAASEGDLLVLFSDGVTEAPNNRDEQFGEERVIAVAQQAPDRPTRAICDAILSALRAFTGDRPTPDDQTLLVVRLWRAADGLDG
jgi:serine phosphatase RsbU (regulator of sigma subunit)